MTQQKTINIDEKYNEPTLNIALDTINIGKQALVFVNTKRGAESSAEKIALKIKDVNLEELQGKISEEIKKVEGEVTGFQEEPIAFGLKALITNAKNGKSAMGATL